MDVLAVLRTVQEDKKRYKIGAKMHVVGYSIGAGVAMWIGVLLESQSRGSERLTRPKVDSISLYGFTSKGVIAGRKNFIDRVFTQAFATEMFVRACGIRGFIGLMRLGIRPNYDALNAQKMNVDDLTHYTCDTNTLDGFAYQVKSWTSFELSRDEIKSIEIPTLILHCTGDERAGHKREHKSADAETMREASFSKSKATTVTCGRTKIQNSSYASLRSFKTERLRGDCNKNVYHTIATDVFPLFFDFLFFFILLVAANSSF